MQRTDCPAREELIDLALRGAVLSTPGPTAAHVADCGVCRREVSRFREAARALRSSATVPSTPSSSCLDDDEIAALSEGVRRDAHAASIAHLARCPACSRRLATVTRLLGDEAVVAELRRLDGRGNRPTRLLLALPSAAAAVVIAGAVAAGVLLRPEGTPTPAARDDDASSPHRESAITTTVAPRILGPFGPATTADSLCWTRVPYADRYRVLVFDREGTLVWRPQTSDTALAVPAELSRDVTTTYLWKVEARTGWDRWVASEWEQLTVGPKSGPR